MEKLNEEMKGSSETRECDAACGGCSCFSDPEDALQDWGKMTPEEKKEYLHQLFRNRSFGCCG